VLLITLYVVRSKSHGVTVCSREQPVFDTGQPAGQPVIGTRDLGLHECDGYTTGVHMTQFDRIRLSVDRYPLLRLRMYRVCRVCASPRTCATYKREKYLHASDSAVNNRSAFGVCFGTHRLACIDQYLFPLTFTHNAVGSGEV
jgi:hypothetical protein